MARSSYAATAVMVLTLGLLTAAGPLAPRAAAQTRFTCHRLAATIVGRPTGEVIEGTPGRDVIVGRGGADTIRGRGGNDVICGGPGNDRLLGGPGNDLLAGGKDLLHSTDEGTERIGDQLEGGSGDDRLLAGRDTRDADDVTPDVLSWAGAPRGVTLDLGAGTASGWGHDTFGARGASVEGSAYSDIIAGSTRTDRIFAGDGNDVVHGYEGADEIYLDPVGSARHGRNDQAFGGKGADQLTSEGGRDHLDGGPGRDVVAASGTGADRLLGGPGNDLVVALLGPAHKRLSGGGGSGDRLDLFPGTADPPVSATWRLNHELRANLESGRVTRVPFAGGFEQVNLLTWSTTWEIWGTDAADTLSAVGALGTAFYGLGGDDTMQGSGADDLFDGGPGSDHSLGMGSGGDTCHDVEVFDQDDCETVTTSP